MPNSHTLISQPTLPSPKSRFAVESWLWTGLVLAGLLAGPVRAEVEFVHRNAELGFQPGGEAACWADFDNDGWVDLCTSGKVWKNNGGKSFTPMGEVSNAVAADFDNDGFVDLFSWSHLKLFQNDGGQGFHEFKLPELPKTVSRGACWGDFNGDGFVDLYLGGYEDWDAGITWPSLVLINEAGKSFRLGMTDARYRARGVTACDFDQDGDLDVYASNYRLQPNVLWINNGKGKFEDQAAKYNALATSPGFDGGHSIGAAWGDFDNDGLFDLFAGNFAHQDNRGDQPKSRFLRNRGGEHKFHFEDKGECGVFYQESYASPAAADYDNDGDLDLFFTTVYGVASFGRPNNPVLFRNDGNFVFANATAESKLAGLGPTYQAAWGDFDNDGDLDLISEGKLFENRTTGKNWLKVRLEGDGKAVNRSAIGAQVRIRLKDRTLARQVEAGTGEGNQNELTMHFGLGDHADPVTLEVVWPNGKRQVVEGVKGNQTQVIRME
ncbi:MAG: CRTAC1 family protein [Planctomycetota bacterium]|nr:CRTAC1 family protein [Planctomycetota bacterium]